MSKERADGKGRGSSFQSFEEKTAPPPPVTGGYPQQKLHQLKVRWGIKTPEDWRKCELVMCRGMDYTEVWRRATPGGDESTWELIEKRK